MRKPSLFEVIATFLLVVLVGSVGYLISRVEPVADLVAPIGQQVSNPGAELPRFAGSLLQAEDGLYACERSDLADGGFVLDCLPVEPTATPAPGVTRTPTGEPATATAQPPANTPEPTPTITSTLTVAPTVTATNTPQPPVAGDPYPGAPLCEHGSAADPDHDRTVWHPVWDESLGCYYDHEHGDDPFTPEVAAVFPFVITDYTGQEIGYAWLSSPIENDPAPVGKHGGFKWSVRIDGPAPTCAGREGVATGVDAAVVEQHSIGNYGHEMEARIHSSFGMIRQCRLANPTDYGYIIVGGHQDFGQRTAAYQGDVMPYPDTPLPAYNSGLQPYFTNPCFGPADGTKCGNRYQSYAQYVANEDNAPSTWISEPNNTVSANPLFSFLFRSNKVHTVLDWYDREYPFTFLWICSQDGGATFYAPGCNFVNSTTTVHEVIGRIPASWDNVAGFDTNPTVGRITAEGHVDRFGLLILEACEPGPDCIPLKLVDAFVGEYGGAGGSLFDRTLPAQHPTNLPDRNVCFNSAGDVVNCYSAAATPAGWLSQWN